jgi:Uroporphyrinogen decarboxylase (URO-D)
LGFGKNDVLDQTHRGRRTPDETGWGAASSLGCVLRLHGYLIRQFEAGVSNGDDEGSVRLPAANVDAAQIFDTWAGVLPAGEFRKWCIEPSASIVAAVRKKNVRHPRAARPPTPTRSRARCSAWGACLTDDAAGSGGARGLH